VTTSRTSRTPGSGSPRVTMRAAMRVTVRRRGRAAPPSSPVS